MTVTHFYHRSKSLFHYWNISTVPSKLTAFQQLVRPTRDRFLNVFSARRYASAVIHVCVMALCLSVCLSQVGVLSKRPNIGSHKINAIIAWEPSFLIPEIFAKFQSVPAAESEGQIQVE